MAKWVDISKTGDEIKKVLTGNKQTLSSFGRTVNQVFEAFTFCSVIKWYEKEGWKVEIVNPDDPKTKKPLQFVKLKFSTRGKPTGYSYARCSKAGEDDIEIRHQLRVSTRHFKGGYPRANVCLDVAVIQDSQGYLDYYGTDDAVPNDWLVSFGEAKHMSAYAELVAGFVGLVHEMQPNRLKRIRIGKWSSSHVSPFLYVSGHLFTTAKGLFKTIERRKYDIDIYSDTAELAAGFKLPQKNPPSKTKASKTKKKAGKN